MKIYRYDSEFEKLIIFQNELYAEFWIERLTYVFIWKVYNLKENPVNWFIGRLNYDIIYVYNMMFMKHKFQNEEFVKAELLDSLVSLKSLSVSNIKTYEIISSNKT